MVDLWRSRSNRRLQGLQLLHCEFSAGEGVPTYMAARDWVWGEREMDSAAGLDISENRRERGEMGYMWFMVRILLVQEQPWRCPGGWWGVT